MYVRAGGVPDNLSWIPRLPMMEGQNRLPKVLWWSRARVCVFASTQSK